MVGSKFITNHDVWVNEESCARQTVQKGRKHALPHDYSKHSPTTIHTNECSMHR